MSQRGSQSVHVQGHHVTQYIHIMQQRDDAIVENFRACRETILDAAQLYAEEQDKAKLEKLRSQLLDLIQLEHSIDQHKAALGQLQCSYQPSLDTTDFQSVIENYVSQLQAADRFKPSADEDLVEFDQVAGTEQQQQEEADLDDDEDLVVVGNVEKNERCPYTRKDVAELDEPVTDQEGFIYEGAAIRAALAQARREHYNWVECPIPGVTHTIMAHHLKPANKRRLQRMAKLRQKQQQQQQQQAATQAGHGRVVLDV